jgi:peptide/nickel transport system ATP-binding protein
MLKGELVEVGDVHQVSTAPKHEYTRKLWNAIPQLPVHDLSSGVTA